MEKSPTAGHSYLAAPEDGRTPVQGFNARNFHSGKSLPEERKWPRSVSRFADDRPANPVARISDRRRMVLLLLWEKAGMREVQITNFPVGTNDFMGRGSSHHSYGAKMRLIQKHNHSRVGRSW